MCKIAREGLYFRVRYFSRQSPRLSLLLCSAILPFCNVVLLTRIESNYFTFFRNLYQFVPNPAAKPFVPSNLNSTLGRSNRTWTTIEGQHSKVSNLSAFFFSSELKVVLGGNLKTVLVANMISVPKRVTFRSQRNELALRFRH